MSSDDFFEYFPVALKERRWGIYSSGFGHVTVPPGSAYPPVRHPDDHHFVWEQGRILQEYQLLYISHGRGSFESATTRPVKITEGTAFIVSPGIWHRYKPDPATGWTEDWIELQGPEAVRLQEGKIINPRHPVYRVEATHEVLAFFEEARRLARLKPPAFSVRIGLIALQILTLLDWKKNRSSSGIRRIDRIISEAQTMMTRKPDGSLSPESIARSMGVGYSYFRRKFKQQTGFSPKQYQTEIRLRRAKDLLRNTSLTIQEISDMLKYHSPYHLSLDFSNRTGKPPSKWRLKS